MRPALILVAVLLPLSVASLLIGTAGIGFADLPSDPKMALILTVSRLPRTLAVILTGAAVTGSGGAGMVCRRSVFHSGLWPRGDDKP
jgi:iron complex transport system permease protein